MKSGRLFIHPNGGLPKYWVRWGWEENGLGCGTSYGKARGEVWTRADHEAYSPSDREIQKERNGYVFIAPISEKLLDAFTNIGVVLSDDERAVLKTVRSKMAYHLQRSADLRSIDRVLSEVSRLITLAVPFHPLTDW